MGIFRIGFAYQFYNMALDKSIIAQINFENALDRVNASLLNLQSVQLQVIQSTFRLNETLADAADASSRLASSTASLWDLQSRGGDVLEEVERLQGFFNERFNDYLNIVAAGNLGTADYINTLRDLEDISSAIGSVQEENRFFFDALNEAQRRQEQAARDLEVAQRTLIQIGFQRVGISIAQSRADFQAESALRNLSISQVRVAGTSRNLREQLALIAVQSIASIAGLGGLISGMRNTQTQTQLTANEFLRLAIVTSTLNPNIAQATTLTGRLSAGLTRLRAALTSTQFAMVAVVGIATVIIGQLMVMQAEAEETARTIKQFADMHPRASAEVDSLAQSILKTKIEFEHLGLASEVEVGALQNLHTRMGLTSDEFIKNAIASGKLETQINGLVKVFEDEGISAVEVRMQLEALKLPTAVIDEIVRRLALSYQGLSDAQRESAQRTGEQVQAMDRLSKALMLGLEPALDDVKLAYTLTDEEARKFLGTLKGAGGLTETLRGLEEAPTLGKGLAADFFVQPPIINVNVDIDIQSITVAELVKMISGSLKDALKSEIVAEIRGTTG